jgi:uncharacterized membrane protein
MGMFEATRQAMANHPTRSARKRRRPRVFMWVILATNALFAWWLVATVADPAIDPLTSGVAVFMQLVLWAVVDVILGVLYAVTRRR